MPSADGHQAGRRIRLPALPGRGGESVEQRGDGGNVAPGPMDTSFFYPAETDDSVAYRRPCAMNGMLTGIEDIAPLVKFLLADGWTDGWWINGQTVFANGGYTTR